MTDIHTVMVPFDINQEDLYDDLSSTIEIVKESRAKLSQQRGRLNSTLGTYSILQRVPTQEDDFELGYAKEKLQDILELSRHLSAVDELFSTIILSFNKKGDY